MEGCNTHSHSHSRTFSKKACNGSNGFFTAYDEVFGGPPKFVVNGGGGIAAFAPRAEDYSEIFGTFHSSSSSKISSIPILDLPPVDDSIASFDVCSSKFDYGEVFRGFEFVEIGVPFDELFRQSDGGDYSSDEAWTPAGAESLSDESDPSACSEKNECFLKGNFDEPLHCKQFNVNCHKVNLGPMEDMPNIVQVDQIKAIPGYTYLVDEDFSLQKTGNERVFSDLAGDIVSSEDSSEDVAREKQLKKMSNHPAYAGSGITPFENTHKPARDHGDEGSNIGLGFISISEVGPRTKPSHLAPPSRAPPIQTDDKQGSGTSSSDQKASKGYASESTFDDNLPPFFDVEVDASSSAAASAAAMKDAMVKAQAKLKSAKELMDKKKDGLKTRNNQGMKKVMDEGMSRMVSDELVLEDERIQGIHESEHNKRKTGDEERSRIVFDECNTKKADIEARSRMFSDEEAPDNKIMQGPCESEHSQRKKNVGKLRKVSDKHTSKKENIEAKDDNKRTISQKVNEAVSTAPHDLQNLARVEESSTVAVEPAERKHGRNHSISAEAAGEWKEASEYFELVDSDISTASFEPLTDLKSMVPETNEHHLGKKDGPSDVHQVLEQHDLRVNSAMNFCKLDENEQESESDSHACQPEMNRWRLKATKAVSRHEYHAKMAKVAQEVHEREICHHAGVEDWLKESWESNDRMRKPKGTCEPEMNERILDNSGQNAGNVRKQNVVPMLQEGERRRTEALVPEENTKKVKEAFKTENNDIKVTRESCGRDENQKRMETVLERKGNQQTVEEDCEKDENYINMQEIREHQEDCRRFGKTEWENEMTWTEFMAEQNIDGQKGGVCEGDIDAKELVEEEERCESEKTSGHAIGLEGYEKILKEAVEPNQKSLDETCEPVTCYKDFEEVQNNENVVNSNDVLQQEDFPKKSVQTDRLKKTLRAHKNVEEEELTLLYERAGKFDAEPGFPLGLGVHINAEHLKASSGTFDLDIDEFEQNFADSRFKKPCSVAEAFKEVHGPKDYRNGTESLDAENNEEPTGVRGVEDDVSQLSERYTGAASEPLSTSSDSMRSSDVGDGSRQTVLDDHSVPGPRCVKDMDHEKVGRTNAGEAHCSSDQENGRNRSVPTEKASNEWTETVQSAEARQPVMPEKKESFQKKSHQPKLKTERRGKSNSESFTSEEKDKADRLSREMELEKEHLRKLEEEREREREREKDRMAYAESRERTERASVEKAAAEARQRAMTEARERLEKACAEARGKSFVEKTSAETRLRAERAAVERATAEARERAIEKAMAERAVFESQERLERSSSEKFSSSARDIGFRQSSFSFNTEKYDGIGDESAQRCRARLERHRRTVDRVAKALAEKNTRDLIAQREQTERNRLAETLDADVKRWSSGKEGNLRALLSTLQYILGPESGWQPVPLTEVITSAAVKKAYRKATLCVHPDKLQQRGATIQQKYICEKVFDLLKAAWNKFNSEER